MNLVENGSMTLFYVTRKAERHQAHGAHAPSNVTFPDHRLVKRECCPL